MRFHRDMQLKWLEPTHPALRDQDFIVTNRCAIVASAPEGRTAGITVFEPRDLDEKVMSRLKARMERPELAGFDFKLYVPPFIAHRVPAILTAMGMNELEVHYTPFLHVRCAGDRMNVQSKLRVLSVDDSPVLLKLLGHGFEGSGWIEHVAIVSEPQKAVAAILEKKPHVVTLDIQMPGKTGVEVVRELLSRTYVPVIMVSSLTVDDGPMVFDALHAGAFDYIHKPDAQDRDAFFKELFEKLLAASESTGVTRRAVPSPKLVSRETVSYPPDLVWALGASTGGTQALTRVFTSLPGNIPPTVVVQHIPPEFSKAFANLVNELVPFKVKEASDGDMLEPNHVYIAAGGLQMGVEKKLGKLVIKLSDTEPVNRFKPSVDYLFNTLCEVTGYKFVAGILTGMGRDGAEGLLALRRRGAYTFAQDEASSAVFGMPRAAHEIGAAETMVGLDKIAQTLVEHSQMKGKAA